MKKLLLLLVLVFVSPCHAQMSTSGTVSQSATTCSSLTSGGCIGLALFNSPSLSTSSATITLAGSFTGTFQFEASGDGGNTWVAIAGTPSGGGATVTSATAAGVWSFTIAGYTHIRARCSAFTSTPTITIQASSPGATYNVTTGGSATGFVGAGASPVMGFYFGNQCPVANTGQCIFTFADTQEADDCAWTSGQPDINCNTAHFTAADVGKSVGGGRTCAAFQSQTVLGANVIAASTVPTIASFISSTHITLSANAANTQAVVSSFPQGGCFVWGHPDDANAALLETAYDAAPQCPKVFLAAAYYMLTKPVWTSQPAACVHQPIGVGDSTPNGNGTNFGNVFYSGGFEIEGRGTGNTIIYLMPNFPNGGAWNLGINSAAAFVVPVEGKWKDFHLTGGWQSNPANWATNAELIYASVASFENFACTNFGAFTTNPSIGIRADWQVQGNQVIQSGCGSIGLATQPSHGQVTFRQSSFENSLVNDVAVSQSSGTAAAFDFACYDCKFFNSQATSISAATAEIVNNGGRVYLLHCLVNTGVASNTGFAIYGYLNQNNTGGSLTVRDSVFNISTANTGSVGIKLNAAGTVTIENSTILGGSAGFDYQDVASSNLFDLGGNTYTATPRFSVTGLNRHVESGTCTFAASTTCTVTFGRTFGNTVPSFLIPPNIPATATTLTVSALSATAATITASASNSSPVNWEALITP